MFRATAMNTIYSGAPYQELPNLSYISVKMPLYSLLCEKECQGRKEKDEEPSIDSVDCVSKRTISSNVLHRTICHPLSTCSLENLYILPFPGLMTLATNLGTPLPHGSLWPSRTCIHRLSITEAVSSPNARMVAKTSSGAE